MVHLHERGAAILVYDFRQFFEPRYIFVVIDTVALPPACTRRIIDGWRFNDNQACSASGERFVKGFHFAVHVKFIFMPEKHPGSGLYNTVPCFNLADMVRFGEMGECSC